MRKTAYKLFWIWDFDKEEKWLNEMAQKGFSLVSVGFCRYTFEECLPGEYNICLQMLENSPVHSNSLSYINLLEEMGAEYIGSMMRWVYFRKKTTDEEFNLFSDNTSRIKYLNHLLSFLTIIGLFEFWIGGINILHSWGDGVVMDLSKLVAGSVCLCMGVLFGYGFLRINQKKQRLKKEKQLFE